ncbi:hypothetical protein [Tsukamurella paurometabola]|uniref:Uncharacterized protein n=1 Tax=Tsukamurella paurometabola TaxID=2061 RepID=A0A3P8K5B5_TSUPA|nr:hypothetical protein [Tsukamurella paurometabola]UEA82999.1 hypothetical protein LK411_22025 [Tsukamurella paurometabola]VDR40084.1 Uncharacterised protein [Tsukamurella paurometabola]
MKSTEWAPLRRTAEPKVDPTKNDGLYQAIMPLSGVAPDEWVSNFNEGMKANGLRANLSHSGRRHNISLTTTEDAIERDVDAIDKAIESANRNYETNHLEVLRAREERKAREAQEREDALERVRGIAARLTPPAGPGAAPEDPTGGQW